jgi:Flp pilus assembly protein TadG
MRKLLSRIKASREGDGAVEFALTAPILIGLIVGTMNLGIYFWAQNSVSNAVDQAARQAPIYPRPTTSELQAVFKGALLKTETDGTVELNSVSGTTSSGVEYVDLSADYDVPVDFIFMSSESLTIPVSASRRVYLPADDG